MSTDDYTNTRPPSRLETINERLGNALDHARYGIAETAYRVELLGVICIRLGLLLLLAVGVAAALSGVVVLGGALVTAAPELAEWFTTEFMAASFVEKAGMVAAVGIILCIAGGVLLLASIDRRSKR